MGLFLCPKGGDLMAFTPEKDLTAIQNILLGDEELLTLLDLTGATMDKKIEEYLKTFPNTDPELAKKIIRAKSIIKRSTWDDLATNEKRVCIYFIPDRKTRNENFIESAIEIDIHVPAIEDYKAWRTLERINKLLHKKKINNRYVYFNGQLGELPTMTGFFCCGSRFRFFRTI